MDWNKYIDSITKKALKNNEDFIDMLMIQAKSKCLPDSKSDLDKTIDKKLIETFLKKRGYTMNYVLGRSVMVRGFVCVFNGGDYIEVFHDLRNSKSVFVKESLLTGLPLTLEYMERI